MAYKKQIACAVLFLMVMVFVQAEAQDRFGRQTGTVIDEQGNPIADVQVEAGNNRARTDGNGKFAFTRLPPRNYIFIFSKEGYRELRVQKRVEAIFNNRPINVTLQSLEQAQPQAGGSDLNALVKEAQALLQQGKFKDALTKLEQVLAERPGDPSTTYLAGLAHAQLGEYEKAIALLEGLIEQLPDHPGVNLLLGESHFYLKQFEESLPYYDKLMELGRADGNIFLNMGIAYNAMEMDDAAEVGFSKALELDPTMTDAKWRLGLLLYIQERYEEAIPHLESYLADEPDGANASDVRGALLQSYLERGIALMNAGSTDEARAILQKAIDLAPDSEQAAKAKVLLEQ